MLLLLLLTAADASSCEGLVLIGHGTTTTATAQRGGDSSMTITQ
jgi:hypothetical protein